MAGAKPALTRVRQRPAAASPWTGARIALLKQRWSQGTSARQISRELGRGISRAAVLGKIRRLGIAESSPTVAAQPSAPGTGRAVEPTPRHNVASISLWRQHLPPIWVTEAKPYIDDPGIDADIPRAQRRSLLELSKRSCRWPVGDPSDSDFFFCGAESSSSKPFCAAHCARAYRFEEQEEER